VREKRNEMMGVIIYLFFAGPASDISSNERSTVARMPIRGCNARRRMRLAPGMLFLIRELKLLFEFDTLGDGVKCAWGAAFNGPCVDGG
jgi:hypothetical protein